MFKVIVDATPILPKPSGIGFYVANLIATLNTLQAQEDFQLEIAYQPGLKKWLQGDWSYPYILAQSAHARVLPLPVRIYNLLLASSFKPALSWFEKYYGHPDIVHGTNYSVFPCQHSQNVMSIYDLTFIKYPQYTNSVVKTYSKQIKQCLKWTDLVLTISENSKKDIVNYFQVNPDSVYVTPLASQYHADYLVNIDIEQLQQRINYNFKQPYLLFVSTIEPRKNLITLIDAFNLLKQNYHIEHNLVLIGQKGWHYKPIFEHIANSPWNTSIYHLDYLPNELVALFYKNAEVFVYPSYYEGFGLPVLEAMTLGAPVITSNTSSLPEVVADAAIKIDPHDATSLAEAILQVISDSQLRNQMIERGQKRAKLYTWEKTAKATIAAYKTLI